MDGAQAMVDRLLRATNDHDVDAVAACFAEDYENEMPVHPARSFRGREQVGRNWEQIFAFVPDLRAEVRRSAIDGETALDGMGDDGYAARWDRPPHARRRGLRSSRRCCALGSVLPRAC